MFTSSRFFFFRIQLIKLIFGKFYSIKFLRLIYNGNFLKFTEVNTKLYINLYIERKSPNAIFCRKPMTHIYSVGVEAGTETSNNSTIAPAGENSLGFRMHPRFTCAFRIDVRQTQQAVQSNCLLCNNKSPTDKDIVLSQLSCLAQNFTSPCLHLCKFWVSSSLLKSFLSP